MAQSISNIHPDCQPAGYLGMLLHRQPPLGLEPVSNMRIRGYLDGEVGLLIPSHPPGGYITCMKDLWNGCPRDYLVRSVYRALGAPRSRRSRGVGRPSHLWTSSPCV